MSLLDEIHREIQEQGGHIPFDRFMALALYAPKGGYYRRQDHIIGSHGDFITAPELSPLFSHCFARCYQDLAKQLPNCDILEFGAGNGTLAADCLDYLAKQNTLPNHYYILELSAHLAKTQKQTIAAKDPALLNRVTWLSEMPETFTGMMIANEVLDAMPVKRFQLTANGLQEIFVTHDQTNDQLQLHVAEATQELKQLIQDIPEEYLQYENYGSEINPHLLPWLEMVNRSLKQGGLYLIDYGFPRREYYHPERNTGTLMCHYHHTAHADPLIHIGEQDITSHVDFTYLAECAHNAGFDIAGYTNQTHFLINCAILQDVTDKSSMQEKQAIKTLMMPQEMGELFKVMALSKGEITLRGFAMGNKLHQL